jgi:myo-inositol-hexaphosphate 3-phosphohydrolase
LDDIVNTIKDYDINHNSTDRDKKHITCGEMKYFRHWNGRIYGGTVYHNINNMWWCLVNKYQYNNIADFNLFDLTPDDLKARRVKQVRIPKERTVIMESLKQHSVGALKRELRRRKKLLLHDTETR